MNERPTLSCRLRRMVDGPDFADDLPASPCGWRKFDLIHALADIHGYRSLLEISTATTAGSYPFIDRSRFDICRRLSYLTPDDWADGAPVDYRSRDRDTSECMREIRAQGLRFDIVFIDAWHEYETARRDLQDELKLVTRRGLVLAHDCLPDSAEASVPFRGDLHTWYGVSYKLYLDVLTARDDLWYCTVDADCGCGMIRKKQKSPLYRRARDGDLALIRAWAGASADHSSAYRLYDANKAALMNVVKVREFLDAERLSARPALIRLFC